MAREKPTKIITPFGSLLFGNLARPSFRFQKDAGEFAVKIHLDESPETAALIGTLDELYDKAAADAVASILADKPKSDVTVDTIKRADRPYKAATDPDTGEPMPGYIVGARLKYKVIRKAEGQKPETLYTRRPIVQDSKCHPVREEVGRGSVVRAQVEASTFYTSGIGAGVSLKLVGVQIRDFVAPGVGRAEFGEVDGFEVSESKFSDPVGEIHAEQSEPEAEPSQQDTPGVTKW